jgi:hypothetical protein
MYVYLATVPVVYENGEAMPNTRAFADRQDRDNYVKAWMRLHDPALDSRVSVDMVWVTPHHG